MFIKKNLSQDVQQFLVTIFTIDSWMENKNKTSPKVTGKSVINKSKAIKCQMIAG